MSIRADNQAHGTSTVSPHTGGAVDSFARDGDVVATGAPFSLSSDLDRFLAELQRDENLQVVELLKASPHETTELVQYTGANGAGLGLLLRKRFAAASGLGTAYQELLRAQRAGRRFQHVPQVYAAYRRDDELVVLMEYVRGDTLAALVRRCNAGSGEKGAPEGKGPLPVQAPTPRLDLARSVFPQLCDAVAELHESLPTPLIHRDIKPENIIVTPACVPVLIDFGIARTYKTGAATDTVHFGTADYAPPEQYGFGQTDIRSDVYALGLVLWFCLTGRVPAPSDRELAYTDSAVPEPLRRVIVRAAAFDPSDRYPSARALRQAFTQACELCASASAADSGSSVSGDKNASDAVVLGDTSVFGPNAASVAGGARHSDSVVPEAHESEGAPTGAERGDAPLRRQGGRADAPAEDPGAGQAREVGDKGARSFRSILARGRDLLARTPHMVGRIWNAVLALFYVLFIAGCAQAVAHPNAQDSAYPTWFLVLEYGVYLGVSFTMLFAALYDTRRLRRWLPRLPHRRSLALIGWSLLYLIVGIVVITIILNAVVLA